MKGYAPHDAMRLIERLGHVVRREAASTAHGFATRRLPTSKRYGA